MTSTSELLSNCLHKKKFLVVDDFPEEVDGTISELSLLGAELQFAENTQDFESVFQNEKFDLVLIDMRIPRSRDSLEPYDEEGIAVADHLTSSASHNTFFLFISAQNHSISKERYANDPRFLGIFGKLSHSRIIAIILKKFGSESNG